MAGNTLRQSGAWRLQAPGGTVRPEDHRELASYLTPGSPHPAPFRPQGAHSASTDCTTASAGTVIDMTAMDRILDIDLQDFTVTVQAGVRIRDLAARLAAEGLELEGSHDLMDRTVGGAVAGGCIGPSIGDDGALFASQLCRARLVSPTGALLTIDDEKKNLLNAARLSYGMLGAIYELTLRIRPVRPFTASHRRCTIDQFAASAEKVARSRVGVKFFLLPFRNRVYLDLRRHDDESRDGGSLAWRIKDWGESTVLPQVFRSLSHIVPVAGIRYRLIDEISRLTQGIVNNPLVRNGSSSAIQPRGSGQRKLHYSTWLFPAADFGIVVRAYRDFCARVHSETGFRCDMPTIGFRLSRDRSALLSPLFDEPMIALRAVSTQAAGWEDFAIDLAEFAEHWGGLPLLNQSRSLSIDHAHLVFGERLTFFRRIRRRLDPNDRMMNPFLSQYFL